MGAFGMRNTNAGGFFLFTTPDRITNKCLQNAILSSHKQHVLSFLVTFLYNSIAICHNACIMKFVR